MYRIKDPERSIAFYTGVLGMRCDDLEPGGVAAAKQRCHSFLQLSSSFGLPPLKLLPLGLTADHDFCRLLTKLDFPDAKFSLIFLGYHEEADIPEDSKDRVGSVPVCF